MKKFNMKKIIVVTSIILITGIFATASFAHMGGGYNMMGGQMGYGGHMMGNGGNMMMGYGANGAHMWESLSAEDQTKMQEQMNTFFSATKEIREQSYKKQLELNQEFLKADKDQEKIDMLQKEVFQLSSKFEEQRFNHYTKMQKLFSGAAGASTTGANPMGTNPTGANFTGMGMNSGYNNC